MISDIPNFGAVTTFVGDEATVTLRGRVENGASFQLGALLDTVINRHPESVVLDLSELEFIGAAGMMAVANAEKRLSELGVRLTVRSPSELVNRLLSIMGEAEISRLDRHVASEEGHREAVPTGEAPAPPRPGGPGGPLRDLRKVTSVPTDPDVIDGALRLVVELARALVEGADGVSVSLLRHGRLSTVAASDQTIMDMDADQYATGEGPCVDASLQGNRFHAEVLATETRWPAFTPRALGLGINSILSSPLKAFDKPVGALNIYSRRASAFDAKDQAAAAVFAKKASVILSDAGGGVTDEQLALRYHEALRGREVITLAKGIIMEREGLGEDGAFSALLRLALDQGVSLRGRAESLVFSADRTVGPKWGRDA
ncbi:MAG: ANTAR domain-containing protein [Acidimicrobiales bacterium]